MKTSSTLGLGLLLAAGIGSSVVVAGCDDGTGTGGTGGAGTSTTTTGSKMTSTTTTGSMTTGAQMSTTGGMTTTGSSMTSSSSGMIVCDPATVLENVPQTDCDLLQQDCDGNQTCAPQYTAMDVTGTACDVNAGLKGLGEGCTQDTECEKGSLCLGSALDPGYCTRVCCPATHEPCGFGKCNVVVTLNEAATQKVHMCTFAPSCTLFTANACAGNTQCHPEEDGLSTCSSPSGANVPNHGACMYVNDCGDMQACIAIGADPNAATCEYVCTLGNTTSAPGMGGCPQGQACDIGLSGFEGMMIGVCN